MRKLLVILLFFFASTCWGQKVESEINGYVCLTEEKNALEGAKITLEDPYNKSTSNITISDSTGYFSFAHPASSDSLILIVSFPFCIEFRETIVPNKEKVNLGFIILQENAQLFDAIEVVAKRNPITVRNDTTIYDAESFMTDADDLVEGMLEILPGILVDTDGNIFSNGVKVDKILVDGQPFFGSDLTIATRNLSQGLLVSVEVFNSKSSSEAFTGSDGNPRSKTINLILREDKKKGAFGELKGGVGFQDRYEVNGIVNRFSGKQQFSAFGNTNNVGKSQLSLNRGAFGPSTPLINGTNGISKSGNIGVNYSSVLNDKLDISSSYLMTHSTVIDSTMSYRKNTLPQSTFYTLRNAVTDKLVTNHTLNIGLNFKATSKLHIAYHPMLIVTKSEFDFFETLERSDDAFHSTNYQEQSSQLSQVNHQFISRFSLTRIIGTKGGVLSLTASNQNTRMKKENSSLSRTESFLEPTNSELRNQLIQNSEAKNFYTADAKYKIVLRPKELFLTFGANYNYKQILFEQTVNQLVGTTAAMTELDVKRTNIDIDIQPNIVLTFLKNKWKVNFMSSYLVQSRELVDHSETNNNLQRQFEGLMINSNINYQLSSKLNFTGSYNLQSTPPLLNQVQTFPNLLNPLHVVLGNPLLKPTKSHTVQFAISSFDVTKNRTLSLSSSVGILQKQVIQRTEIDNNFVSTSSFENADGGYNVSSNANYRKRMLIDSLYSFNVDLSMNASLNVRPNINSGIEYNSTSFVLMPSVKAEVSRKEYLKIKGTYRMSFSQTSFDINDFETQTNIQHNMGFSCEFTWWRQFTWLNGTAVNYNPSIDVPSQQVNWIWNSGISFTPKDKNATFSITLNDVLNSNSSALRSVTSTYTEYSRRSVLKRYLLFSVSWRFRKI